MNPNLKKAVLLVLSMMTILAGATIAPALPGISEAFRDSKNVEMLVALVLTAPALAIALTASIIGPIIDRIGRKPVLISATFLYGVAGSSGLYLDTLTGLIIGRFALGVAVAAMMTATNALIADYYEGAERQSLMGAQSSAIGFSGVLFLLGGGFLAEISWRIPFAIYLSAFIIIPAIVYILHEPPHFSPGRNEPLSNMHRSTKLSIVTAYLLAFIMMVSFYIIPVKLPFYLMELGEMSTTRMGLAISCGTLSMAIVALFYQRLRKHFSLNVLFAFAFLTTGTGFFFLAHASTYSTVLMATSINGIGFGVFMPNLNVWLADLAPENARGRIFGGLTTALFFGQFISPILSAPVIARNGLGGHFGGFGASSIYLLTMGVGFAFLALRRFYILRMVPGRQNNQER